MENPTLDVVENPTLDVVRQSMADAESCNVGCRVRLCYFPPDLAERILATPEGIWQDDGGGVANCYGHRAGSTVLGAAWYTDGDMKRVEIAGTRSSCFGRHVTPIWGAHATAYSVCQREVDVARCRERIEAIGGWDPDQADDRLQIVDPYLIPIRHERCKARLSSPLRICQSPGLRTRSPKSGLTKCGTCASSFATCDTVCLRNDS